MNAVESRLLVDQTLSTFRPVQPAFAPIERPRAMTVVCLFGFLHCVLSAIGVLIVASDGLVFLIGMAMVVAYAACLNGLWRMRAWSLPSYVILMAAVHVLALIGGGFSPLALLLTVATLVVGLTNLDDMQ